MDFQQLLDSLLPLVGPLGVRTLGNLFEDLAEDQDKPWAQAALGLLADAVDQHGLAGIMMARKAIEALIEDEVPNIEWANPRVASDFVAKLQNAEADDKSAARDFIIKLGDAFGEIVTAVVKGLLTA